MSIIYGICNIIEFFNAEFKENILNTNNDNKWMKNW